MIETVRNTTSVLRAFGFSPGTISGGMRVVDSGDPIGVVRCARRASVAGVCMC